MPAAGEQLLCVELPPSATELMGWMSLRLAWSPELGFGLRPPEGAEGDDNAAKHPDGPSNPAPMERVNRRAKAKRGER